MKTKQLLAVIKELHAEVVQSASDLDIMAAFAIEHGDGHLCRMCLAQREESLKTVDRHKVILVEANKI